MDHTCFEKLLYRNRVNSNWPQMKVYMKYEATYQTYRVECFSNYIGILLSSIQPIVTIRNILTWLQVSGLLEKYSIINSVPNILLFVSPAIHRGVYTGTFRLWVSSVNHPGTVPPEQAIFDLEVAGEGSQVRKIYSLLPFECINVHGTFPATQLFWDTHRLRTRTHTNG